MTLIVFFFSSVGGVKRPAEGSKEEPSERKKNLPVVAKTFVSKTAIENRIPSTLTAQTSPKLARAAVQVSAHVRTHHRPYEIIAVFTIHLTLLLFLIIIFKNKEHFVYFQWVRQMLIS